DFAFPGKIPVCKKHRSLSCQQAHAAVYFSAQQRNTQQHVSLVKHTHSTLCKTQHST
ncbi:unnamed protein product, partial [Staurois parvus]